MRNFEYMRTPAGQITRVNNAVVSQKILAGWEVVPDPTPASSTGGGPSASVEAPPSETKPKRSLARPRKASR